MLSPGKLCVPTLGDQQKRKRPHWEFLSAGLALPHPFPNSHVSIYDATGYVAGRHSGNANGETKTQKGEGTSPRTHCEVVAELGCGCSSSGSQPRAHQPAYGSTSARRRASSTLLPREELPTLPLPRLPQNAASIAPVTARKEVGPSIQQQRGGWLRKEPPSPPLRVSSRRTEKGDPGVIDPTGAAL